MVYLAAFGAGLTLDTTVPDEPIAVPMGVDQQPYITTALGASEVRLLELAGAIARSPRGSWWSHTPSIA
jgi:hypothetical protein